MSIAWKLLANPSLRLIDSEKAHSISVGALSKFGENRIAGNILNRLYKPPELPIEVFGHLFQRPLGLAAGFDKGAEALLSWPALGFSWSEYGGVTRYPQEGNKKPRMFRANKDRALVNSMGFNNPGASEIRKRLIDRKASDKWPKSPVAANIGRSKKVSNDQAADDYSATLDQLWEYADLFVLNISSPNTPGLRELQENDYLESILSTCIALQRRKNIEKPILLKLSPDSSDEVLRETVNLSIKNGIGGIVASNTTVKRPVPLSTQSRKAFANNGGLSGRPLHSRALEVISMSYDESRGRVPIIGVGGIDSKESAWESITSGSSLIQLYSALVFNGPSVTSSIVKGLKKRVKESGFSSISEAVGYKHI